MKSWKLTLSILIILVLALLPALAIALENRKPEETSPTTNHTTKKAYGNSFDFQFEPDREVLPSRKDAQKIVEGMSVSEVYAILGSPQRDTGSGIVILEWDLDSGEVLVVSFGLHLEKDDWIVICSSIS